MTCPECDGDRVEGCWKCDGAGELCDECGESLDSCLCGQDDDFDPGPTADEPLNLQ